MESLIDLIRRGRKNVDLSKVPVEKLKEAAKLGITIEIDGDAKSSDGTPLVEVNKTIVKDIPVVRK